MDWDVHWGYDLGFDPWLLRGHETAIDRSRRLKDAAGPAQSSAFCAETRLVLLRWDRTRGGRSGIFFCSGAPGEDVASQVEVWTLVFRLKPLLGFNEFGALYG